MTILDKALPLIKKAKIKGNKSCFLKDTPIGARIRIKIK